MWQDKVNSLFLLAGASLNAINVWRLYKDKQVKGVSVLPVIVFATWGVWDLYYFPTLNQWVSMAGSALCVVVNGTWIGQVFYYRRNPQPTIHYGGGPK